MVSMLLPLLQRDMFPVGYRHSNDVIWKVLCTSTIKNIQIYELHQDEWKIVRIVEGIFRGKVRGKVLLSE